MTTGIAVPLWVPAREAFVEGQLHERVDEGFAVRADECWSAYLAKQRELAELGGRPFPLIENEQWVWKAKVQETKSLLSMPTLAIDLDGVPQGMMTLVTDGVRSRLDVSGKKSSVYVRYLATAPWNLSDFERRYKGVGTILVRAAVQISLEAGFKGRICLHALPKSEEFYDCLGLTKMERDKDAQDLTYYELDEAKVDQFIGE